MSFIIISVVRGLMVDADDVGKLYCTYLLVVLMVTLKNNTTRTVRLLKKLNFTSKAFSYTIFGIFMPMFFRIA